MRNVVVLVAHGTVSSLDDLEAFVREIRHGRPAPDGLIRELRARYEKVGGSPLLGLTEQLARAVGRATGLETRVAMRLWQPRLRDVVSDLDETDNLLLVPVAPFSLEVYRAAAEAELASLARRPQLSLVRPFGNAPELVRAWCDSVEPHLRALRATGQAPPVLLQSAHSLPQVVIDRGDTYELKFREAAKLVQEELARRGAPFDRELSGVVFQSQGAMDGAWLGPALDVTLRTLKERGAEQVCVLPMGFLSEHIETLYDLDVEARAQAAALGLTFGRAKALNDAPGLVEALRAVILEARA
jgi:protoporphyrin/coproporphyrin ferrochelatase